MVRRYERREVHDADAPDREIVEEREIPERERLVERRVGTTVRPAADEHEAWSERRTHLATWSPAQAVALIIGIGLTALGAVGMARGGFDDVTTHVNMGGLHHTTLLGIIELAFGVLMMAAGAIPGAARGAMVFLGALALAFGIMVAVGPAPFHDSLATHSVHAALYITIGAVSLLTAMAAPVISGSSRSRGWSFHRDY